MDALIGGYRTHPGVHSASGSHRRYNQICDEIADRELAGVSGAYAAKLFRKLTRIVAHIPKVRSWWHKVALQSHLPVSGVGLASENRRPGRQMDF